MNSGQGGNMGTDPLKEHLFPTISADAPPASRQLSKSAQRHSRYSCSFPPPAFLPRPSRPPPLRSLRQTLCVLCVFPLRIPCSPLAPKIFSNRWKTAEKFFQSLEKSDQIFQPLEKSFPIIGKNGASFPTIGKFFSNHWKTRVLRGSYQIVQNPGVGKRGQTPKRPRASARIDVPAVFR